MDKQSFSFDTYISPLTWRYGSESMRKIFSEQHKYELWRKIWIALAKAEYQKGILSKAEYDDLVAHEADIDISRILELEKETKHDVMAAIKEFAEKAKIGGGKIHVGATSMDIVDNADTLRMQEAINSIASQVETVLTTFGETIAKHTDTVCMAYTHLQPAEPTTIGYRLSFYAQDLRMCLEYLHFVQSQLKAKGMKGAVGTQASYTALFDGEQKQVFDMEDSVMKSLDLTAFDISSQVSPRMVDYFILTLLASIGTACAKFAADVRLMQSPGIGEWSEPFGKNQVGSSAMPFKKNPILSENICSLARYIADLPTVALGNARHSYLERTLDDSANKRIIMPEGFLIADEILSKTQKLISGLQFYKERIAFNLHQYGPFAATEVILMKAVKIGGDRQKLHEVIREVSLKAWDTIAHGQPNPMEKLLMENTHITSFLKKEEIQKLLDPTHHIGTAATKAKKFAKQIQKTLHEK